MILLQPKIPRENFCSKETFPCVGVLSVCLIFLETAKCDDVKNDADGREVR